MSDISKYLLLGYSVVSVLSPGVLCSIHMCVHVKIYIYSLYIVCVWIGLFKFIVKTPHSSSAELEDSKNGIGNSTVTRKADGLTWQINDLLNLHVHCHL